MQPEQKVNVLLVDDRSENLLALEAILDSLDQNLVKANSGEQALRCLLNQDFAVILLDVQMPGMDGFEAAALIRQRERSRHTPIIFLTAFNTSETLVSRGYSLGAVDYLLKPIQPQILLSKVAVFVDLYKKTAEVKKQAAQLAAVNTELKESEERFRSLSACSPVGIFLTDVEGRFTYTNPCYQAICGFTLNKVESWMQLVYPEDCDRISTYWSTCLKGQQQCSNEFRLLTQQGIVRWVHIRSSPMLSDKGELIAIVGTVEDITERKQAEEAQTQFIREQTARQEAEAANRMKDEFLATLSHELRTPLNSMLGWARLLRTKKFDEKTTARALETIERNASLQAQLIEDILDVSRIIRGKVRLNLCPVNLISVIETGIDTLRPVADDKGIHLESLVDYSNREVKSKIERSPFLVCGDPDRLQQVIWNLLSNAIKFTPRGGKVEIRLLISSDSYAQIQVIDTGIGISKDFLPFVFDRFRQADSTTTRSQGGLGLGLAIVQHLVEMHGGTVHVHSDGEGQGVVFTAKLPLYEGVRGQESGEKIERNSPDSLGPSAPLESEPTNEERSKSSTLQPLTGLRVLVVDDDTDTRHFLTTVLEQSEARVIAVASVGEALEALAQLQPDVLVSDIGMPEEDGYALIRKVRNLAPHRGGLVPAAALTAYVREEDCTHALSQGFQMYLSKPIEPAKLIAMVAKLAGMSKNS